MGLPLQQDLDQLHREILSLSGLVEEMVEKSTRALARRDLRLADDVIDADELVDRREVRIEENCLKALALHQPVAADLRRIATVLKVNNDLERMADLAVNLARRAKSLVEHAAFPIPERVEAMVVITRQMISGALDAFVTLDSKAAGAICLMDQQVDGLNREVIEELQQTMAAAPLTIVPAMHCFSASRHIERLADHATNIAEDVIFLVEGDIVRHGRKVSIQ